jgi:hypothetical protein
MADVNVNIKSIDNTNAGFASANRNLQRFANSAKQTTKGLLGTITGAGLGSALGSVIGLNLQSIADGVARALTGISKEAEDAFKRIETASDETADIFEKRMKLRRTDEQEFQRLTERSLRLEKQIAEAAEAMATVRETSGRRTRKITKGTEQDLLRLTELQNEQQQVLYEIELIRKQNADAESGRIEALKTKLQEVNDKYSEQEAKLSGVTLSGREQLEALRQSWSALSIKVAQIGEPQTVEGLERAIELTRELTDVSTKRHAAELQAREGQRQAAEILGQGFEKAIVNGEKFSDVLKQIGKDLVQLVIRRSITNPLVDAISGFNFGSLLGRATGGPVSRGSAYMVGENGPEMFLPTQSGNIVSNERMSAMGGSTYYIDARGADRSGLARLEQMILQTQASIQPIALQSVVSASARGII